MRISTSYYSAAGGRANNEDAVSLLESRETVLAVVADGLGGRADGELASELAVKTLNAALSHTPVSAGALRAAVEEANARICADSRSRTMCTTVAALWLDEKDAVAANVGDTRIYQFRNGSIVFQTRDHSLAQLSVHAGELLPEEVRHSRERHQLLRALGADEEVRTDLTALSVRSGDAFLLCSDGFWEKVQEAEMASDLALSATADEWIRKMRGRAERRGALAGDNHTAAAILIRQAEHE